MMRFLQRQRKSIRSGEFFKCHLCLLLIAAMLVAAALLAGALGASIWGLVSSILFAVRFNRVYFDQIGRASCRERV